MLTTAKAGKNREQFGKNAGEWTERVEMSKEEIPVSKRSTYVFVNLVKRVIVDLKKKKRLFQCMRVS